jgi:hypothetical protein
VIWRSQDFPIPDYFDANIIELVVRRQYFPEKYFQCGFVLRFSKSSDRRTFTGCRQNCPGPQVQNRHLRTRDTLPRRTVNLNVRRPRRKRRRPKYRVLLPSDNQLRGPNNPECTDIRGMSVGLREASVLLTVEICRFRRRLSIWLGSVRRVLI